jgi:hypothetical protein
LIYGNKKDWVGAGYETEEMPRDGPAYIKGLYRVKPLVRLRFSRSLIK